jgi:hypothetical protein
MGTAPFVDKVIAKINRGVVYNLRLLIGEQFFVAAVRRNEALAHGELPEKDVKDIKDCKDAKGYPTVYAIPRESLFVLAVFDVLYVLYSSLRPQ